jgi:branched-chain amino acid transport system permease protein
VTGRRAAAEGPRPVLALHLAILAALLAAQFVVPPFQRSLLARIMVLGAYAAGYNVLFGYTGLMSLGHATFFAAGMYATGLLVYYAGAGAVPAFAVGLVASVAVSIFIGLVTLRTGGVAFLIVTMMFAQVFYLTTLYFNRITGGDQGLILAGRLPPLRLGSLQAAFAEPAVKYNVALAVFAACFLLSLWLVRSPAGRVLIAVRENEERTRLLGYNTFAYKLFALALSGGLSGMAGSAYTLLFSYLGASFASVLFSIYPLLWTLLGGAGTTIGPVVGTAVMTYIIDLASGVTDSYLIVVGVALVLIVMRFPAGIVGTIRARWAQWLP